MDDLNDKIAGGNLTASEWNQVPSEIQNIIENSGLVLSAGDLNQLGKAIANYVAVGDYYADTGATNAFILSAVSSRQTPPAYVAGMRISWIPSNAGTGGATTVNVATLGVKSVKTPAGSNPVSGDLPVNQIASARYDGTNFLLTSPLQATLTALGQVEYSTDAEAIAKALGTRVLTPANLAALGATTSSTGLVERLTQAEMDAGTDTSRYMTVDVYKNTSLPPGTGSVNQSALKTTTGEVSQTEPASGNIILAGGSYGFYPRTRVNTTGSIDSQVSIGATNTSYATNIHINSNGSGGTIVFAEQRYIQSSPPYNLGDGDIQLFVFVLLDKLTKKVVSTYSAPDPVWANNGPTVVNAYSQTMLDQSTSVKFTDVSKDPYKLDKYLSSLKTCKLKKAENFKKTPMSVKNADMKLVPHPFPDYDPDKNVIVMLDPVSGFNENLFDIHTYSGDSIAEILHGNFIKIGTDALNLSMPDNVIAVKAKFK